MKKADLALGFAFALLGGVLGLLVVLHAGAVFFYQNFTPEVVYFACGFGLRHPGTVPPALLDFLFLRATAFDCSLLGPVVTTHPPGLFVLLQGYLSWPVALTWWVSSPRYTNLWPIVAFLTGLYTAGCFALLRLFFRRPLAAAGAFVLSVSPLFLVMIFMLRDFSKAPFFIWAVVFSICALKAETPKRMCQWAAASAAMVGIGSGFRTDIVMLVPILAITLLICWPRKLVVARIGAVAVFLCVFVATSYPALIHGKGSSFGSVIIQGMSDPFRAFLKMTPAPYAFGARYSDELVLSSIAADERPRHPAWDAEEGSEVYNISAAMKRSGQNWLRILPLFPADFVAQAFKTAGWIMGMPALVGATHPPDPAFQFARVPAIGAGAIQSAIERGYRLVAQPFLPWLGMAGMLVFFWRIWNRSPREALALAFLFTTLMTYPVVQFSIRHVFHLEFIWIIGVLALIELAFAPPKSINRRSVTFAGIALLAAAAAVGGYRLLAEYQQRRLTSRFEALLALPREFVGAVQGGGGEEKQSLAVPVPAARQQIIASSPDSMTSRIPAVGLQWDVRSEADRMLVSFEGESCRPSIEVTAVYAKKENVWQPMDQTFRPLEGHETDGAVLLFPAFYRATQHLSSVDFLHLPEGCRAKLERIDGPGPFPALMTASLPANWRELPLLAGLGGF